MANKASGSWSSVSGGVNNTASGGRSWVSGGWYNTASGWYSSVSGGGEIGPGVGVLRSAGVIKTLLGGIGVQLVEVFPEVQLLITAGLQEPIGRPNRPATTIGERVCAHKLQPFRL
jgi:hypothetical protein